jgi:hypothetical protein
MVRGILAATIGVRPTLWIAVTGASAGALWLLPSPLPRFRMPAGDDPGGRIADPRTGEDRGELTERTANKRLVFSRHLSVVRPRHVGALTILP